MVQKALEAGYNIRRVDADHAAISLDETATCADIAALASALAGAETSAACDCDAPAWDPVHTRQTPFCTERLSTPTIPKRNDALHPPPGIPGPGSK